MLEILKGQGQDPAQEQEASQGHSYFLEVIDRALDKGVVIEGWSSVGVLGIEVLTLDFTSTVASFAKHLAYASAYEEAIEAIEEIADRFDTSDGEPEQLPR